MAGLIGISLMTNIDEHHSVCFLVIYMSSLKRCLLSFSHLKLCYLFFIEL